MKVAVTGANGHVGVNLCRTLLARGHQVKTLTHKNTDFLKGLQVEQIRGDVLNPDSLTTLTEGADVIFHLAARISITGDDDGLVRKINADGTRNVVEAAKVAGVKKFIHFSSIHAFRQGPSDSVLDETRPLVTNTGYAYDQSKAIGERVVKEASQNGLDAVIISPTAILGPQDPAPSLVGEAVIELYRRKIPAIVPGGYNWVDVRDVVEGALSASERGMRGEKYLLSGTYCPLPEFAAMISRIGDVKATKLVMPFWVARVGLPFITAYSRLTGSKPLYTSESINILQEGNTMISNEKARRQLNYNPRSLEATLTDLIAWFRESGHLPKPESK